MIHTAAKIAQMAFKAKDKLVAMALMLSEPGCVLQGIPPAMATRLAFEPDMFLRDPDMKGSLGWGAAEPLSFRTWS
jgi:hypothetical protein